MMTGQGRELEAGENMGVMGGFVSAKEDRPKKTKGKIKTSFQLLNATKFCFIAKLKYFKDSD